MSQECVHNIQMLSVCEVFCFFFSISSTRVCGIIFICGTVLYKSQQKNLEQLEILNDQGGAQLKHYQWSCLLTDLLPGSEPISSAGYYLLFVLYITKIVLLIYHLYCCIVSIIYSDHAEIPGKLSNKENGIECVCIQRYLLCF